MASSETTEVCTQASELFMLRLRYKEARLVRASGRSPVAMNDPHSAWIVYKGRADVFLVPVSGGEVSGTRRHLLRAEMGQVVFGMDVDVEGAGGDGRSHALLAVGGPDTQLLQVRRATLERLAQEPQYADQVIALIDGWVAALSESMAVQGPPQGIVVLEAGETTLEGLRAAHPNRDVLWVSHLAGRSQFMGIAALPVLDGRCVPLSNRTWLEAQEASRLRAVDTQALVEQDGVWPALDAFHSLALACIAWTAAQAGQAERERWQQRAETDARQVTGALEQLAGILEPRAATPWRDVGDAAAAVDPLLAVCRQVGRSMGITVQPPPRNPGGRRLQDPLRSIARASRIRIRRVALRGAWYRGDNGPLVGYREVPDGEPQPVALLLASGRRPRGAGRYDLLDPLTRTRTPVTPEVAATLLPFGYLLYRPLPDRPVDGRDLLRMGLGDGRRDLLSILLAGLATGALGLVTPVVIGILFDTVIPGVHRDQLVQIGLALLVGALAAAMFQLARNVAVLRLAGRLDASVQAAVWDRLLRLPAPFFRRYTAGDLAERVLGIQIIRQTLSEAVVFSLLAGVFSLVNLVLLFYYAPGLAWGAAGLVALAVAATLAAGYWLVRYQRKLTEVQGYVSGMVLQLVTGIAKLRVAGVEGRAFARWARAFSRQRALAFKSRSFANSLQVFNAAFPLLALLAVFALLAFAGDGQARLSTGAFLAFNAAFTQLLVAGLAFSAAWSVALGAVPVYERVKPILLATPEVDQAKADPGTLAGALELSHVSFRYSDDDRLVLQDVSLQVRPGEFVALVGPSGCGKSTLLRLLLKFETPLAGAIYYDGQDLDRLDVEAVRRQIGVVLQDGKLIADSILANIVGSSLLTADDAWEAVRSVGMEEDIRQMPMGLHTVLSDGGANLSGGQRQRLLIARAIVHKPRLLFLDEATSALDNPNQALVGASLERLSATRVVIAHRLSTIVHADRIYVLDAGRVVQSGTYAELMGQHGPFAELARRQLA